MSKQPQTIDELIEELEVRGMAGEQDMIRAQWCMQRAARALRDLIVAKDAGIAQERERCARVAEAEEQECETMRSAYANDAYNWSFWERSRKTASSIAVAIRAGDASE